MINFIKKYRRNPKRTVVTFSFQKKFILNRLGDLIQKNDEEMVEEFKREELKGQTKLHCACGSSEDNYVLEKSFCGTSKNEGNSLKEKKKQIEIEQAQILEKDDHKRAFKENYHIRPLEYEEKGCVSPYKKALCKEKDMRGGVVCEKSFKILLCDLACAFGVVLLVLSVLFKSKRR